MTEHNEERLLILTKTYPIPSKSYRETVCVAAINEQKELRRLYPIAYRFLKGEQQFKRWQWIRARITKSSDKRPESYNLDNDSISLDNIIDTKHGWEQRLALIEDLVYPSFSHLEQARLENGTSLGFIKPKEFKLTVQDARQKSWTADQLTSLHKSGLFDPIHVTQKPIVQKIPYDIYYDFTTDTDTTAFHHLVTDWEVGALFWNCKKSYGDEWELYLRKKLEDEFSRKDLLFLMGTMHQFPNQWLIIGLVYPPQRSLQPNLL